MADTGRPEFIRRESRRKQSGMSKRALRIAIPVFVVCLVAGSVAAFFAGGGSLSGGEWKTASGVSLQVPTAGAPKLVFTAQPAAGTAFQASAGVFSVSVTIEDSHGTPLSDDTDTVTLRLPRDPGGGALSCTNAGGLTVTVAAGQATFSGCSISKPGTGYQLTASSSVKPALAPPANGHTFDIVSAAAAKAAKAARTARTAALRARKAGANQVTTAPGPQAAPAPGTPDPGDPAAGVTGTATAITSPAVNGAATASPVLGPITVQLTTTAGTPVTTGATVELSSSSPGHSEFAASSGGTAVTSVVIAPGTSSTSFYYGDELAGRPVITAAVAGAQSATQTETVTAGRAAGLSFTSASAGNGKGSRPARVTCSGPAGSLSCTLSPAPSRGDSRFMTASVQLVDQFQNVVANSGSAIDVALTQSGGSSVSASSVSIAAGASSSAPFTEQLAKGTAQGTVSATATVGSSSVSATLTS
jgi:hypothetical protein